MKINPSAFQVGKTSTPAVRPAELDQPVKAKTPAAPVTPNTDKVQISRSGSRSSEVEQLAQAVSAEAELAVTQERLDMLREQVQSNKYNVSTDLLVDSLLNRWIGV